MAAPIQFILLFLPGIIIASWLQAKYALSATVGALCATLLTALIVVLLSLPSWDQWSIVGILTMVVIAFPTTLFSFRLIKNNTVAYWFIRTATLALILVAVLPIVAGIGMMIAVGAGWR